MRDLARGGVALSVLAVAGCTAGADPELSCTSRYPSEPVTLVSVECTAAYTGTAFAEFGEGALGEVTPEVAVTPGEPFTLYLYGMPAETRVPWRVHLDDGSFVDGEQRTGSLPLDLPALDLTTEDEVGTGPRFLLVSLFGSQPVNAVIDRLGRYVWYRRIDPALWSIEATFAKTGEQPSILVNEFANDHEIDLGQIRRITWTGEELATYDPVDSHHIFTELGPDAGDAAGTIAYLAIDIRDWTDPESGETMPVVGDKVVEIAPDGTQRTIWSIWDWAEVTQSPEFDIPFYPQGKDWSHANAIHYYPEDDVYLVSFNNLAQAVEFRRSDGVPVRWMGVDVPEGQGLTFAEGSLVWNHQHDVRRQPDGHYTAFATDQDSSRSGGVEYAVDEASGELVEVWRGGFELGARSPFLGQMTPLDDGNVLVNYGGARILAELTRSGGVIWSVGSAQANFFGESHPFESFYTGE